MTNLHLILNFFRHFLSAKRNGHGVHSPFAFALCEEVFYNRHEFYDFESLKLTRNLLLKNSTKITVTDFGAGSKFLNSNSRSIKDIAGGGISSTLQSEIFYKLINYLKFETVIELGTSIGLNTLYLSKSNPSGKVISIEGSKSLTDFSRELARKHKISNIQFVNGKFDDVLPGILSTVKNPFLLYVDGNHSYNATVNYFNMALQKKENDAVIILDDIYWSSGMTKAWEEIKKNDAVTLSIDAFYFGLVFFRTEQKEKIALTIFL